jgi:hypothetical protein
MKPETDSITDDELVLRLVWEDYYRAGLDLPIQPGAFEPKKKETTGISLFRRACLASPEQALAVIAEDKRGRYHIAALTVAELKQHGLTVQPDPRSDVPGHVLVPELNIDAYKADKGRWKAVQRGLAELASRRVVYSPPDAGE